jgi:hypothetical protein
LPLLTQPVKCSPNRTLPGGQWLKGAKGCERNGKADRIMYSLTTRELKGLSASATIYPTPPRSLHWLKWRGRDQQPLRTGTITSDETPGSKGVAPIIFDEPRVQEAEGILKPQALSCWALESDLGRISIAGRRCHGHARIAQGLHPSTPPVN